MEQEPHFIMHNIHRIAYQSQPQIRSPCVYTQMAISVVLELGLDKPPRDAAVSTMAEFPMGEALPHLRLPVSSARTMNERRAAISCYILSSAYGTYHRCHSLEISLLSMPIGILNSSVSWSLSDGTVT